MIEVVMHVLQEQVDCLTEAIYHEARGEDYHGQLHVGFVIRNRVMSDEFPDDFCQVIKQPWQFSFVHELDDKVMYEEDSKEQAQHVAEIVLTSENPFPETMLYYHADHMTPDWNFDLLDQYKAYGNHIFYTEVK